VWNPNPMPLTCRSTRNGRRNGRRETCDIAPGEQRHRSGLTAGRDGHRRPRIEPDSFRIGRGRFFSGARRRCHTLF
jgi:hypothetical protein